MKRRKRRSDYKICPYCGASLDVGEVCDCKKSARRFERYDRKSTLKPSSTPPAAYHGKGWSITV